MKTGNRITCYEALKHNFFASIHEDHINARLGKEVSLHVGKWEDGGWRSGEVALLSILKGFIKDYDSKRNPVF